VEQKYSGLFARVGLLFLLALLVFGVSAKAQIISGDLVGTIFDKSGAAVPGATVEAINVDTKAKYTTQSNEAGEYRFSNLPIGSYDISASAANFATTTVSGLKVELNKVNTMPITLEIRGAVTQVEVSGALATLDTTTSQITATFDQKLTSDMPSATSGSGVLNLALLSSGVGTSGGVGVGTGPSVGGQRPRNNNFTVDGVDNNSKSVTGPLVMVPNDAVSEFSVLQNQFSPEFGHSSGGQFNTIVRSGTNSYHGLAYVYNQNRHYDALDTLQALAGAGTPCPSTGNPNNQCAPGPRFDSNRFGGNFGGPILKNKLFFFANFEYDPLGQAAIPGSVCAPTAAGYATINATPGLSATNVAQFEKYVPAGTLDNAGCTPIAWVNKTTIPTAGLQLLGPNYQNTKDLVTSVDWNISTSDQIRGRYIYEKISAIDFNATFPVFYQPVPNTDHLVAISEYHTFSPTLTNEFRLGFNRNASVTPSGNYSFPGLDSFPNLQFNDTGVQLGPDPNAPQSGIQNTYSAANAITWTKNRHTLTFGIEGRKLIAPQTFTQRVRGDYEYTSSLLYFQDQTPDYLAERSNGDPVFYGDQAAIYWFANDTWQVSRNLTLNLGVRYEYTTTPFTSRSQSLNNAVSVPGLINFVAPNPAPNNWAPRIGIAYSPGTSGRTSIRAGFSEAYDVLFDNLGLLTLPPQLSSTNDCFPLGTFNCPVPFLGGGGIPTSPGGFRTFPTLAAQAAATSAYLPAQLKDPKSLNWTLGVQHTFANDFTAEIRYVGTRGIHLPAQIQLNKQPVVTPNFNLPTYVTAPSQSVLDALPTTLADINNAVAAHGNIVPGYLNGGFTSTITSYQPAASSSYHGLAAQLTKRMSHGLQFIGSYTYSHLIDDATAEVFSTVIAPRRAQNGLDLRDDFANSILDHRHRFTLAMVYDLPFFKQGNWFVRNGIGNWEFAPIYTYQSGQWATAQSGVDSNKNGDSAGDRTILNPAGVKGTGTAVSDLCTSALPAGDTCGASGTSHYVVGYVADNPSAQYIQAQVGALADVGRNTLQFPAINNVDMSLIKRISITERYKVEFQAQFFNILNHPQWVGGFLNDVAPFSPTSSAQTSVLRPQSSFFNAPQLQFSSNPRTLQLALKFFF
jgi:hypothetical protein